MSYCAGCRTWDSMVPQILQGTLSRNRSDTFGKYNEVRARGGVRRPLAVPCATSLTAGCRSVALVVRVAVVRRIVRVPRQPQAPLRVVIGRSNINAHVRLSWPTPDDEIDADLRPAPLEIQPQVEASALSVFDHLVPEKLHVRLTLR